MVASSLGHLAGRVGALSGWRQALAAVALGVVSVGALPPLYVAPLLLVAFSGLLWLAADARSPRAAAWLGWCFGFGHYAAGLYWITNALLVDAAKFGWLVPFAVSGLSAFLALFAAAALWLAHQARARGFAPGWRWPLIFALAWTAMEWLRGHILTGFPWNQIASVWVATPTMTQSASLFGAYGLTLITVAAAASCATFVLAEKRGRGLVLLAPLALCALFGVWRMSGATDADAPGVNLRLVQGNVDQRLKWQDDVRVETVRKYLALSAQPTASGAPLSAVIWPETAVPFFLSDEPELRAALGQLAAHLGPAALVITGTPRAERDPYRVWNSVQAIDARGEIVATYDKFHLVPFGEYMPLRWLLPFDKITPGAVDFSAGPGPRTLALPGLPPASPLVCYEVIFPGSVADRANRPGWLLNVTNDGWFGISSGPHQHLASARLRAVEEGLPVARAANTGISAIVDSYGRLRMSLALGRTGTLDGALPAALPPTLYARFGDFIFFMLWLAGLGACLTRRR
ncbi:MAG: apolipoprotein N-acyltransferase [Alphaproteobacteria bacterium]